MTSGETVFATETSAQQSALRLACDDFRDEAEEKGWVAKATSFFGFASRLINGDRDEDKAKDNHDYAELIGAQTAAPNSVFERISADADAARYGLVRVTGTATSILAGSENSANRSDVMSYESALLSAQKSHRAFARAADLAAMRAGGVPQETETALSSLANEIDAARDTADVLAERYASLNTLSAS